MRYGKRERQEHKAAYALSQERMSSLRMSHVKPERAIQCDKYGNVFYRTTKDSTMYAKGCSEVMNRLHVEGPSNSLMSVSIDLVNDSDKQLMDKTDRDIRKQDSVVRKLTNVDQSHRNASAMVRVGTTPARKLLVTDSDGNKKMMRISEKPKFVPVGLHTSVPRT